MMMRDELKGKRDMNEAVDMVELIKKMPSRRRGKACAVMTRDYREHRNWASKLAERAECNYLDLMELFRQDRELTNSLRKFSVRGFFDFLKDIDVDQLSSGKSSAFQCRHSDVMIVSDMEFLIATWIDQSKCMHQFARQLETWNRTPCLLLVIQHDRFIESYNFKRHAHQRFVVKQQETLKL